MSITERHRELAMWLAELQCGGGAKVIRDNVERLYAHEIAKRLPDHTPLLTEVAAQLESIAASTVYGNGIVYADAEQLRSLAQRIRAEGE